MTRTSIIREKPPSIELLNGVEDALAEATLNQLDQLSEPLEVPVEVLKTYSKDIAGAASSIARDIVGGTNTYGGLKEGKQLHVTTKIRLPLSVGELCDRMRAEAQEPHGNLYETVRASGLYRDLTSGPQSAIASALGLLATQIETGQFVGTGAARGK